MTINRPYIIIPKLIQQPTWGGTYIAEMKNWNTMQFLEGKRIGQSYELFSGTKLALTISDTSDPRFVPELGFPDTPDTVLANFPLREEVDYMSMADLLTEIPGETMPILIKFTQSLGNSFQIHIKPGVADVRWHHKAESWYYFEPGLITFGIKKGININDYKSACLRINAFMLNISSKVKQGLLDVKKARQDAKAFIAKENPWQYVNMHGTEKYEIIDQGLGGIHHSWEEDEAKYPLGNVLYEIQEDVMDPISTIRAFDQGKIKDDGSIRDIHIDDYFKYLDTNEAHNDVDFGRRTKKGDRLLTTPYYALALLDIADETTCETEQSFNHLFVRDGAVEVTSGGVILKIGRGHSCFIPRGVGLYKIRPQSQNAVVLKTFLEKK